jgi:Cof subfamily protein (haloacid dehalogenase superfamily)
MPAITACRFLAAIDLDGTLFGPAGTVGPENFAALERLARHGFAIALASGRHAQNMAEIAATLPMVGWIVGCQGGEVTDRNRRQIFARTFMEPADVLTAAAAGHREGFGVVAYTVSGELTPYDGPEVARYRRITHTAIDVADQRTLAAAQVFKVMWIGPEARLDAYAASGRVHGLVPNANTVRSHREVFEFGPRGITKATGTALLARHLGLAPAQVAGFGDADNDTPLFDWAGFSVAMPQARPEVQARASVVAPAGPPESAFARGVEQVLAHFARSPAAS